MLTDPTHGRTEEECGDCPTLIRDTAGKVFCASPRCHVAINERARKHNDRLRAQGSIAPGF